MAPTLGDRAAYSAYRLGSGVARPVPPRIAVPVARRVARGLGHAMRARRAQVARNLERIVGPLPDAERDARISKTFENYGRYWYELFRLPSEQPDALREQFLADGYERLVEALADGRGAIAAVPHVGGWDFGGAWFAARGLPLTVVVEPVQPPELFDWFVQQRTRLGMEVVPLGSDAGARVARALSENRVVALLSDRDLTNDGVPVDFFGERTTMPGGPALLALRTGAPILPTAVYFEPGQMHTGFVQPPVAAERRGSVRADVLRITQDLAGRFESLIRAEPEQWFVLQPNWPSDRRGDEQ